MTELKPCPFCGGKAEYHSDVQTFPVYDCNGAYIDVDDIVYNEQTGCPKCDIWFYIEEEEEEGATIGRWNRRADK